MPLSSQLTALEMSKGLAPTPANLDRITKATDAEAARWAFGQWDLRARAKGRFPEPERLLFVREALEQATHRGLSEYHASLFPAGKLVVDLTCGIGGDLMAFAARGPVLGFELDAERADYARWNLEAFGRKGEVRQEDGLAWLQEHEAEYVFADPARRVDGKRTLDPDVFSPDPFAVAEAASGASRWAMKLTPMLPDETLARLALRIEFVSFAGECREALAIGGSEPLEPGVWAVHPEREPLKGDVPVPAEADLAEGWLHDADPAAVRAHALGNFGLSSLGDSPGYLVGPTRVDSPWLRAYEVIDDVAPKRLKATLKALEADVPVLKQRGAGQNLDVWRKDLKNFGKRKVAVAFYVRGASVRAAVISL
ncbi:class I SAM-dependent methyltransferase [bacterium]|nr:MAG: class I SAM-dependent methyltransferase [bacterium]